MIELQNVTKKFHRKGTTVQALSNVNLTINKGDIFGVIGYSGAGKSTLIRLINRLEQPTEGKVLIDGKDIATLNNRELRQLKKRIGMVFQTFNLLDSKTIYDNVAMPLVLAKINKAEIDKRVKELLAFVELEDKANNYPNELSGGQKQRIGIARALASNPEILLCDEATSALDPKTTKSILKLLKKINEDYGITILIITHEMSVIQEICNRVAVTEKGRVIEQGSVLEVFGKPQHPSTQYFVKTVIHDEVTPSIARAVEDKRDLKRFKVELTGELAAKPLLQQMMRMDLEANILFANTNEIQNTTLVILYINLSGSANQIQEAIDYLRAAGALVEEVPYENSNHT